MRYFLYAVLFLSIIIGLLFFLDKPIRASFSPKAPTADSEIPGNVLLDYSTHSGGFRPARLEFCSRPFQAHYSLSYPFGLSGVETFYDTTGNIIGGKYHDDTIAPISLSKLVLQIPEGLRQVISDTGFKCTSIK